MAAYLSPLGNEMQADANGDPLVGGKIYTYLAGTTTPAATYTSSAGVTPQANPIILNSLGLPDNPLWLGSGVSMKMVIKDSTDVTVRTIDNVLGVNDPSAVTAQDEWVAFSGTPTYLSATTFSVAGDQTGTFQVGRRLKSTNAGGTVHSTITASAFGAGITTLTVRNDSGTLDAGLSSVSYGLVSILNSSLLIQGSLSGDGYQRLPGGMIIQWGGGTVSTPGTSVTVALPLAWPNAGLQVVASHNNPLVTIAGDVCAVTADLNGNNIRVNATRVNLSAGGISFRYVAIGW